MEKVKIRGLVRIAGWIFHVWGGLVAFKGLYDSFFGEPEANLYSPEKWEFVTQEQWLRWSGFEIAYGLACIGLGFACWEAAKRLPDWVERAKQTPDPNFS
ncbi:MAG: hypothetical protein A2901_07430 [Elusimicrobia bacterium RIFCSPLOWO2_01_FULL_54_10]|nr:MAG: hypothetical protein A2901_07430 [Elusimicrobia bacterium RIFCSPLOWO2_01_FULL_54_10]